MRKWKQLFEKPKHKSIQGGDEIGLGDILQFIILNGRFLALTTIVLSAIAIPLLFLQPRQYQKQLSLSVSSAPISATERTPALDAKRAGALAAGFLRNPKLSKITAQPKYNTQKQSVDLTLQSSDTNALSAATPKILKHLKRSFQKPISEILETTLITTEQKIQRNQKIVAQLEQRTAQSPRNNNAKQQDLQKALRAEQARTVAAMTVLEVDKDELKHNQRNIADFTTQVISVKVLSESDVEPTRSLQQQAVIAVIASFMAAVVAAIISQKVTSWNDEPSTKQKNDTRTEV